MPFLRNIASGIRSLFQKKRADRELDEELRGFMEMAAEESMRQGSGQQDALRVVRLERGSLEAAREVVRSAGWESLLETSWQDLCYGLRVLRKSPGFTAVAVLTLALGIGANTAIFSVINSVLLKPLPFPDPGQLVSLRETESAPGDYPLDGADYLDWQEQNKTFASMSLYTYPRASNASGAGEAESAATRAMQANFFETLGVKPVLGRAFAKGEDLGTHRVVILSYGFWQRHFGGQANALGETVELDDQPYTVIGVMPRWLSFPTATDLFIPLDMTSEDVHSRGSHWAEALGRVKNGVTIEQARADLLTISERVNKQYRAPDDQAIHSLVFPLKDRLIGDSRSELLILFGAVALVLLVACANIANLLLARSTARKREMAVRAALGAGRWRLARQMLTESILLALGGATLGLLGASWGVSLLRSAETVPIPRVSPIGVDATVLLFTAGVSVLVGMLFGLAPALQSSALNLSDELKSSATAVVGTTGGDRMIRNTLIVAEIAVSLALLVGAGLLLRSFARMRSANIGARPQNVLTVRVNLPLKKYNTIASRQGFFDQLLERVRKIPGVTSAAVSTHLPLEGGSNGYINVPGNSNPILKNQLVEVHWITPDYFRVFGIPLIEGRTFTEEDMWKVLDSAASAMGIEKAARGGTPKFPPGLSFAVVINQAMARIFWPNQNPVGKEFFDEAGGVPWKVIGVVGDVKELGIRERAVPERYFPLTQRMESAGFYGFSATVVVKTSVDPLSVLNPIRSNVAELDSSLALFHGRTMEEVIADHMGDTTLQTFLLGLFALLTLILAGVGLYGVMSYLVTQRTHEIGTRMALGARPADVLRMVIRQGITLVLIGVVLGVLAALGATRLIASMIYGVTPYDPLTFVAVAAILSIVALAACYIPARRAMRVDPMVALRYE